MPLDLILPASYPYILMGLSSHCIFLSFMPPIFLLGTKRAVYTPEHMNKYQETHKEAFGPDKDVNNMALPDQGTGWYSKDLGYKDWIDIQKAMRIPMNYIEQLPIIFFLSLIAGLYFPMATNVIVWIMLVGRILYSFGYKKETKARVPGAIIGFLCAFALILLAFISACALISNSK